MLAASELLKALKEDENTEIHKDSNDDYDFGKVLDLYKDTSQSNGDVMFYDGGNLRK